MHRVRLQRLEAGDARRQVDGVVDVLAIPPLAGADAIHLIGEVKLRLIERQLCSRPHPSQSMVVDEVQSTRPFDAAKDQAIAAGANQPAERSSHRRNLPASNAATCAE